MLVGNLLDDLSGHNRLDDEVSRLHKSFCLAVRDDVPQEDQCCLVSVDKLPLALVILASHANAVGIRVAGHKDVSVNLLG